MQYAVIETGGKQYKITKGMVLEVERLIQTKDSDVLFDKVLLYVDGERVEVGMPYLKDVSVAAKVLEQMRGEKIRVAKFKAKSHYKKAIGHRQSLTQVRIEEINVEKIKNREK